MPTCGPPTSPSPHFTVTNTGSVAGAEIAQVYVSRKGGVVFRPEQELKGFVKVFLNPGECKTVTVELDDKAFRYFNVKTDFEVESGDYELRVGASCADIRLTATVAVKGKPTPPPPTISASLPSYCSGKVRRRGRRRVRVPAGPSHPPPPSGTVPSPWA